MSFTVDASVVSRWLISGEEYEAQAVKLRNDHARGFIKLYAPELLTFEVLNSLWKAVEKKIMKAEDALVVCEAFIKLAPKALGLNLGDLKNALKVATDNHITFYDASYIATALRTESTLITADKGLYETARSYVKAIHLKDY